VDEKIQNFAGVIVENAEGQVLLAKKIEQYAYAILWCRIVPGRPLQDCLRERVMDLTGLSIQPVFLGPSEHIDGGSHFISFDHTAKVEADRHHYIREGIDYLWAGPEELPGIPMVPLTRQILEKHFLGRGIETWLSSSTEKVHGVD
jgi:hypothetical protein